jgi:hypothetical protein
MKSLLSAKNLIAVALILFGIVVAVTNAPKPIIDEDEIAILDIKQPSPEILALVSPTAKLITDPTDRAKLAIFNQEFATRIRDYTTDNQKTNDVYVLAASYFFKDGLKDKYDNLDNSIVKLLESSIGDENHILTDEEKSDITAKFMGLAWALIQKP